MQGQLILFSEHIHLQFFFVASEKTKDKTKKTSVQAGAVLMPLAMFLLSLKSIRVLY